MLMVIRSFWRAYWALVTAPKTLDEMIEDQCW